MGRVHLKDMDRIKSISNLNISPCGDVLAFCLECTCIPENRYKTYLYSYELKSGNIRRISCSDQIQSYCFDQNGMLIYTYGSSEEKEALVSSTEFWTADPLAGEEQRAFTLPLDHAKISFLSDDRFVISAPWDLELEKLRAAGDVQAINAHLSGAVIVCDEYPYRVDGLGYINKKRNRLYEFNRALDTLRPITPPTFRQHDYAAEAGRLYVLGEDYEVSTSQSHSVYCWDKDTFRLCASCKYMLSALAVSGSRIFASTDTLPEEMDSYVCTAVDGEMKKEFRTVHTLFNHISTDFSKGTGCEFLAWNGALYYTMQNRKGVYLYRYADGCETRISSEGIDILHFTISPEGRIFAAGLPELGGPEIYEIYQDREVRITEFNKTELEGIDFVRPEHLVFRGSDGCEIDGWVVPPADYNSGKKYPAILNIHGGPQLRFYGGLNFFHQLWAAKGYYVIYCNPHGSIGDTAAFSDLRKKYGTIDYEDIMQFVDIVLSEYPSIDERRMGVTGISYGGFMTNWIITRSNRFAAAASQSGISDWISLHATDDLPGFDLTITGSMPWEDITEHWRISPLAYAGQCKTPTLFIECGEDYRCPVDQGLGMYQALIAQGVPSRTVIFNGETHCVFRLGKPLNRIRIFNEITDWFERYIPKG